MSIDENNKVADTLPKQTDDKTDLAFIKLRKELKQLKTKNAVLSEENQNYKIETYKSVFIKQGGRNNAFKAWLKVNGEVLEDGIDSVNWKQQKKEHDYLFNIEEANSSNDGIKADKIDDGLGGFGLKK